MKKSPRYVWQKLYEAIDCMCGDGEFSTRLKTATAALEQLNDDDMNGELGSDLAYILGWTKHNIVDGTLKKLPNDAERSELIEKMLHVMLRTYEK